MASLRNGSETPRRKRRPDEVRAWTKQRHNVRTYRALQVTFGPLARGLFRVKAEGMRKIPKLGPVILVHNHASNLDPIAVIVTIHRPVFHLAKHTLFTKPFRSWFFQRLGGQIPVRRAGGGNEAAIQAAVRALEQGHALSIYPEGHRTPDGRLGRGRPGLGRIAYLTGAPCYPVALQGTFEAWPKGKALPRFFQRVRIRVGPPRRFDKDPARAADRAACQQVTDQLMTDVATLLGQPYDPAAAPMPRTGPGAPNV